MTAQLLTLTLISDEVSPREMKYAWPEDVGGRCYV